MKMRDLSQTIESLHKLGEYIRSYPEELKAIVDIAEQHNGWFDPQSQQLALQNVSHQYLDKAKLQNFTDEYQIPTKQIGKIGIIMAGNIPLVGIHDLICVLLAGHKAIVKLSSKDEKLMKALIMKLKSIDSSFENDILIQERLSDFDAVIATGSNNSSRYFDEYFGKYPHIIRKNRNSIAVLTGSETEEELHELGKDIFQFYGLGCRNVSKLFVPKNYNFEQFLEAMNEFSHVMNNTKYKNNFDYNLTLLILNKIPYQNNESLIVTEDKSLHSRIATVHYEEYDSADEVNDWIIDHKEELQVVIGKEYTPFGTAQEPQLDDFADNVDTMEFLANLKLND